MAKTKPKPVQPSSEPRAESASGPRVEMWPIDRPKPYERNPRRNDAAVEKVAASIREFGWDSAIVVDRDGVIIAGHTRLKAAKRLGLAEVPVIVRADLTPEQARALRLADNKTGEFAEWDEALLGEELVALAEAQVDMEQFGFGDDAEDGEGDEDETPPRITSPLDEQHEYVLIVCDNNLDWEQARTVFNLGQREGFRANRRDSGEKPPVCFSHVVSWSDFAGRFLQ